MIEHPSFSLYAAIPFFGLLSSISFGPLICPKLWHKFNNYIIALWGLIACICVCSVQKYSGVSLIGQTLAAEYFPLIVIITSLYVISTGIHIHLVMPASPAYLTGFLGVGSILSSLIGTTGASIVLINPLIELIHQRAHKTHIIVFFIYLVANCGGALTPLGDPPLFMGFIKGVSFLWPLKNLWYFYCIACGILLFIFYFLDKAFFYKTTKTTKANTLHINGYYNIGLLLIVILIIFAKGTLENYPHLFSVKIIHFASNITLLILAYTSLKIRRKSEIDWEPLLEVIKIFAVIFIAIIPINAILENPSSDMVIRLKHTANTLGTPNPFRYFWMCGFFSSILDNAPTYIIFFNMAGGKAHVLMEELKQVLIAISLGATFFGGFTYIGNAPNLIIRAIATNHNIQMPSFLGYIGYSFLILFPVFLLISMMI